MIYIVSISVFYFVSAVSLGIGRKILSLSKIVFASAAEEAAFSYGIGFGTISYLVLALGVLKILYPAVIGALLLLLAVISYKEIIYFHHCVKKALAGYRGLDIKSRYLALFLFAVVLMISLASLAPSYSNDSLVYHLKDAKYFANNHVVGPIPYDSTNALWPYLVEMYFTLALLFKLSPLAGLFHFSLLAVSAIAIYAFAKRYFSRKIAFLASTIFILTPGVFMEAKETYIDLGMVFYAFLAFYAFCIWLDSKEVLWVGISGIMSGLAISVKYFIAVVPIILVAYLFYATIKNRALKPLILFIAGLFLASFVWYLRQYIVMGNPVFPFLCRALGTSGLDAEVLKSLSEFSIRNAYGIGTGLKSLMTLPWQITMFPQKFGGEQIGPLFLAIIPILIVIKPLSNVIKRILWFSLAYIVVWFFVYQNLRFFLPVVPFLSIASSCAVYGSEKHGAFHKIIMAAVVFFIAISCVLCFYHDYEGSKVVLGLDNKDSYLARNERSFEISKYINQNLPGHAKILVVNEGHTFFIDKDNARESYYWMYDRYDKRCKDSADAVNYFKSKGFSYILYAETRGTETDNANRLTSLMLNNEFRNRYVKLIYEQTPKSKNANGIKYTIYEI